MASTDCFANLIQMKHLVIPMITSNFQMKNSLLVLYLKSVQLNISFQQKKTVHFHSKHNSK